MSIYDDVSGHGLEAHSRWVGSSGLADCGLLDSDVEQIGALEESSIRVVSLFHWGYPFYNDVW